MDSSISWAAAIVYLAVGTSLSTLDMLATSMGKPFDHKAALLAIVKSLTYTFLWPVYLYFELQDKP